MHGAWRRKPARASVDVAIDAALLNRAPRGTTHRGITSSRTTSVVRRGDVGVADNGAIVVVAAVGLGVEGSGMGGHGACDQLRGLLALRASHGGRHKQARVAVEAASGGGDTRRGAVVGTASAGEVGGAGCCLVSVYVVGARHTTTPRATSNHKVPARTRSMVKARDVHTTPQPTASKWGGFAGRAR